MKQFVIPVKTEHFLFADALDTNYCPLARAIKNFKFKKKLTFSCVLGSYVMLSFGGEVLFYKMEGWHEVEPKTMTAIDDDFGQAIHEIEFIEKNIIKANNGEEIETVNVTLTQFKKYKKLIKEIYIN